MLFGILKLHKALLVIFLTALLLPSINKCLAQCNSQIGTLNVLNPQHQDGIFICYKDTLQVELDSYELMDSQQLFYVYHDGADILTSNIIKIDTDKTDGFINLNDTLKMLYLTAIVSDSEFSNWQEDNCTVFSNTVEFYFLSKVHLDIVINPISRKEYNIRVLPMGGMPEFDNRYKYFLTGNINDEIRINEISRFRVEVNFGEKFNLYMLDTNGCTDSYSQILSSFNHSLPIILISFDGQIEGTSHLLKWVTGSEINSDYFLLEVSKNRADFEVLDSIKGAGTTAQANSYRFINEHVIPGTYQYKLSQVDFDGDIELLGVFELSSYALQVFPNPTDNKLSFQFNGAQFNNLRIQIFDSTGRKVLNYDEIKLQNNQSEFTIYVHSLAEGIYFAQIWGDNFTRVDKFIVEK